MLYREKTTKVIRKETIIFICLLVLTIIIAWFAKQTSSMVSGDISNQTLMSIENAVTTAAMQCYAVEGVYPQTIEYLEGNYGLQLNRERYIIDYEVFASNVLPNVTVLQR